MGKQNIPVEKKGVLGHFREREQHVNFLEMSHKSVAWLGHEQVWEWVNWCQ